MGKYNEKDIEMIKHAMWKKSVEWVFDNYDKEEIQELNEKHKMGKAFNAGVEAAIELFDNTNIRLKEEVKPEVPEWKHYINDALKERESLTITLMRALKLL